MQAARDYNQAVCNLAGTLLCESSITPLTVRRGMVVVNQYREECDEGFKYFRRLGVVLRKATADDVAEYNMNLSSLDWTRAPAAAAAPAAAVAGLESAFSGSSRGERCWMVEWEDGDEEIWVQEWLEWLALPLRADRSVDPADYIMVP